MFAAFCHIALSLLRAFPTVFLVVVLLPQSAVAVSTLVVFSASEFSIDGASVDGTVSGTLEVEDRDGDGTITALEVQAFAFFSEFAGTALDGTGDLDSHAVFDMPGTGGTSMTLAPGLETHGLGFIDPGGFPGLPGGLGGLSLLTLTDGVLGIARGSVSETALGGPTLASAVSRNLEFLAAEALVPVPVPGTAGLPLVALAGLTIRRRRRSGVQAPDHTTARSVRPDATPEVSGL